MVERASRLHYDEVDLYTLKPLLRRRPRARSNFLPFEATYLNCKKIVSIWELTTRLRRVDVRLLARVRTETEMLHSLSGVLWSSEEEGVCTSWCPQGQLIKRDRLTTRSHDPRTSSRRESQRSNGKLWQLEKAVVVRDGPNDDDSLIPLWCLLASNISHDPR